MAKKKKKTIASVLKKAGWYLDQAAEKAGIHEKVDPETPEEWLGWLIDEWEIQSVMGWENYKKDKVKVEKGSESEYRFERAMELAKLVSDLLDLGVKPLWPWVDKRKAPQED